MTLKKSLKYMIFTFLFMFLFVPNVNASTKYMVCDYEASNAKHKVRLYYENSTGKFNLYYIAAYGKSESKWSKYSSNLKIDNQGSLTLKNTSGGDSAIKINDLNRDELNKNIMSLGSERCPKINVTSNGNPDKNLSGEKEVFKLDDLSCKYESNKSYSLSSWFVGVENLSKSNPKFNNTYKFERFVLPSGDEKDDYGYPTGLDKNHNYSDQTYMYYYLKNASKYGCPRSIAYGGFEAFLYGGYKAQINNIFYLTYKWGANSNDLTAIDPSGKNDSYGVANLICNTEILNIFTKKVENNLTFWTNDFNYYSKLDENGWKKVKSNSSDCRDAKNMGEFKYCLLKKKKDTIEKYYSEMVEGNEAKQLKKVGCDKELKEIDLKFSEIKNLYMELIKQMQKNGEITDEQAENLTDEWEQAEENINGLIESFFSFSDSELKKLAGNKNKEVDCNAIFGNPCNKDSLSLMCFVTTIFNIIRYLIPAVLIILGSVDFAKVVMSNDKEAMSKAISIFVKRVIIAIVIFLLPLLINFILKIFDSGYSTSDKINCVIESLLGDSND